jgi:hypothetical protein
MGKKKSVKRRGVVYVITPLGRKQIKKMTGQARLIVKAVKRLRKTNAKQLRKALGKAFKTKNAATNVIGVYLSRFRRKGLLAAKLPAKA